MTSAGVELQNDCVLGIDIGGTKMAAGVVTLDGEVIGEVTSGTFSPTRKQGIALALLDRSVALDTEVLIDVRGRGVAATVVNPPFVQVQTRQD